MARRYASAGYTLVELVVVVSILAIIAAIVVTGFQNYQKYQWYQVVVNDIRNDLNQSRAKTLGSIDGEVYGVYIGTSTIEFFSGSSPVVGSSNNKIYPFTRGITATSTFASGDWYVTFSRLTGLPSTTGTIDIVDASLDATTTLSILESGIID